MQANQLNTHNIILIKENNKNKIIAKSIVQECYIFLGRRKI